MKHQREWTIKQLKENGRVSRNQALSQYFSRLGAVICDLRSEGWEIDAKREGTNYIYRLIKPAQKVVYEFDLVGGVRVPRKVMVNV